jgi:acyl transferase domain-containing protein
MGRRLAMLVSSIAELREKLGAYLDGGDRVGDLYRGEVKGDRETLTVLNADEDTADLVGAWMAKGKYDCVAELWVKGLAVDWAGLYGGIVPRRVSLPTYPFAREQYWIPELGAEPRPLPGRAPRAGAPHHPLLHENVSQLGEQRYRSVFAAADPLFAGVDGARVLRDAVLLEMARAAFEHGAQLKPGGGMLVRLKNLVWSRPVEAGADGVTVCVALYEQEDARGRNELCFEIFTENGVADDRDRVIHLQGTAERSNVDAGALLDLAESSVRAANGECTLVAIAAPSAEDDGCLLRPGLVDAALRDAQLQHRSLREVDVLGEPSPRGWVHVRYEAEAAGPQRAIDVEICGDDGRVWLRLRGQRAAVVTDARAAAPEQAVLLKSQRQVSSPARKSAARAQHAERWVILAGVLDKDSGREIAAAELERRLPGAHCIVLERAAGGLEQRFTEHAVKLLGCIQKVLSGRPTQPVLMQLVIGAERDEHRVLRGLGALLKTAQMENPKLVGQLIEMEGAQSADALIERLESDASRTDERELRYRDDQRWVVEFEEIEA